VNTPLDNILLDLLTAVVPNFFLLAYLTELQQKKQIVQRCVHNCEVERRRQRAVT
jgi:hypothetical protein